MADINQPLLIGTLYIFGGLPASGKSQLARSLAQTIGAVYLRVDTIEQAIRDVRGDLKDIEGYNAAIALASDNLKNGLSVVADSVNPLEISRQAWRNAAIPIRADYTEIEVKCSDKAEHRRRVEARVSDIPTLKLPTWQDVCQRSYDHWTDVDHIIDTAGETPDQSLEKLLVLLKK